MARLMSLETNNRLRLNNRWSGEIHVDTLVSASRRRVRLSSFTLIELLGVVLIIIALFVIGFGVATYVQRRVAIATTRAQIAAIEVALESYRSDLGILSSDHNQPDFE